MQPTIVLREASPDDAPFLAWAVSTAALGAGRQSVWEVAIGPSEAERRDFLQRLVVAEPECAAHYSGFVVAVQEGRPVAAACGFIPEEKTPEAFTEAMLCVAADMGWSQGRQLDLLRGFTVFNRCLPMTRSDRWVLEYIACLPEVRGRGVTRALLEELLECGRDAAATIAQVAYFLGNEPARKLYGKLGFREVQTRRDPEFRELFGSEGVVELICDL